MSPRCEMNSPTANSRVSPGRIGKNSPHSMKMISMHTHRNHGPNWSSSQLGSIQLIPNSKGCRVLTGGAYPGVPDQNLYAPARTPVGSSPSLCAVSPSESADRALPRASSARRTTRCRTVPPRSGSGRGRARCPTGEEYDERLLLEGDRRNVVDRYRYWSVEAIVADLDTRRHDFHVAIENWQHDFNIGTIVRSANAFLAREVHIVGLRRWNRRGAMVTDRYQHVRHHESVDALAAYLHGQGVQPDGRRQPARLGAPGDLGHAEVGLLPVRPGGARALRAGPGALRRDLLDRAVRLDPVDQRLGGRGHRDARLDQPPRRPRPGVAGLTRRAPCPVTGPQGLVGRRQRMNRSPAAQPAGLGGCQ